MSELTVGLIGILIMLLLFCTGIEIGFAMAAIGFLGFASLVSVPAACNLLAKDFFEIFSSYGLTVLPVFMLMGQIASHSGIATRLFKSANKFVGQLPGGLAMATVGGAAAFGAICGSQLATAATFSSIAIPEMDRYDYDKRLSTGIVASGGILAILIPPSSMFIILGIITEQSIGKLFMAGVFPGLILAGLFIVVIYFWCKFNPSVGPKGERQTLSERVASLKEFIWPLLIFTIIIGGLMKGLFSPTEAGSAGVVVVLIVAVVRGHVTLKGLKNSLAEATVPTVMVLTLVAGSTVLGHFIAVTKAPLLVGDVVDKIALPNWLVMTLILFIYLAGGSFVDDLAFMLLITPILYPIATTKLGYDGIWFCVMLTITMGVGVIIPPVAACVFIVRNVTRVPFSVIYRGVYPFLFSAVILIILVFVFPEIATWLPKVTYK